MAADPVDIAKFTKDGVVITSQDVAIDTAHPDAQDERDNEREMFFVSAADGQVMLDEAFDIRSRLRPVQEGIEVNEDLGLGTTIPVTPTVPSFQVIDSQRGIDALCRVRAYAYESEQDRYSVEVMEGNTI